MIVKQTKTLILGITMVLFVVQLNICASKLPKVAILGVGGTIAGVGKSETGVSYSAGKIPVSELLKSVPGVEKFADISAETVANIPSQDMNDKVWFKLAKKVNEMLNDNLVDAIVITHGTDTMEETAYFLDLILKTEKPVILTGAMRPSTSISADGPINIFDSVVVAASPESYNKGVLVVMNGKIFDARDVTKTNTTNVATFESPNTGPIGYVDFDNIQYYTKSIKKQTTESQFDIEKIDALPEVCIIYEAEGGAAPLIEAAVKYGYKGIVVAGVGDGNMPKKDELLLVDAVKKGISVVISSRVGSGCVQTDAEIDNTKEHLVTANNLNPQKARILLRIALTQTNVYEELQKIFNEY